jgi:DNA-binding transcriptional LysR family regulator
MDRFETLRAFVAVADQRGFAAAARTLNVSPPAVTRAVAALERHLGATLFQRSTRAVSLTDEGIAFLERARRILADLLEAEQVVMGRRAVPRGQLFVTAPVMFGRKYVLPTITALLAKHDDLTAHMMLVDRNVRIVEEGIDVAVRIGPLVDSTLRAVPIGTVELMVVASPDYLAKHGVPTDMADLKDHHYITGNGLRMGGAVLPVGARGTTAHGSPRLVINTIDGTIAAAEAGMGLANVLSYQSSDAIAAGRLVRVLADQTPAPVPVSLLYDAGRATMPAVRAFIDAMRERSQQGGWD